MSGSSARQVVRAFHRPSEIVELSPRERQGLELLAQGYSYKEIADQLGLSVTTVCCYLCRVSAKPRMQSRA